MSAISNVNQSIAALLRPPQFAGQGAGSRPQGVPNFGAKLQSFAEQAGYDPSAIANVKQDLQSAIETVRAGGVEDPRSFISSTVRDSLEANGIDAKQLASDLRAQLQASGFGGLSRLGGAQGVGNGQPNANAGNDLLNELFANDDEDSQNVGDLASLLNSRLPAGTLVNVNA